MAGCGFGSQVMGENGNQVFAATTNGSLFGSQFFGITSGTSNCLEPSQEVALTAQQRFIADNFSALCDTLLSQMQEASRWSAMSCAEIENIASSIDISIMSCFAF